MKELFLRFNLFYFTTVKIALNLFDLNNIVLGMMNHVSGDHDFL
jgi:hypothetical protein